MKPIGLLFLILLFYINHVNCSTKNGGKEGFNLWCGALISGFVVGTPIFFIVNYFVRHFEKKRREEIELRELEKKIHGGKFNHKDNKENRKSIEVEKKPTNSDSYGTAKILKEVIERHPTFSQIYSTPPMTGANNSPSSSPRMHRSNSLNSNISFASSIPISASEHGGSSGNLLITNLQKSTSFQNKQSYHNQKHQQHYTIATGNNQILNNGSSSESSPSMERSNRHSGSLYQQSQPSQSYLINSNNGGTQISPIDTNENISKLLNPPSPVLSTFGKSSLSSKPTSMNNVDSPVFSPSFFSNLKRTLSQDDIKTSPQQPPQQYEEGHQLTDSQNKSQITETLTNMLNCSISCRPKSLTVSQNNSLLTYLSSNTIPKDHWNCIVHRILELSASFWCPPKYDCQASLTSLNQIELALSGFSEQEQIKKNISVIDDQKYFSSITFELQSKIFPLHEFIRNRNSKIEKDINGVFGVFLILLPSLFNSFSRWLDEISSDSQRKLFLEQCRLSINEQVSLPTNSYKEKKIHHKFAIYNLIDYIRTLLFFSIKKYSGFTLYKIVDKFHGIADDIDKTLYQVDNSHDLEQLVKTTKNRMSLDQLIEQSFHPDGSLVKENYIVNDSGVQVTVIDIDPPPQPQQPSDLESEDDLVLSDSETGSDTNKFTSNSLGLYSKSNNSNIIPIINTTSTNPCSTTTTVKPFDLLSTPKISSQPTPSQPTEEPQSPNPNNLKRDGASYIYNQTQNNGIASSISNRFNHIDNYLFSNFNDTTTSSPINTSTDNENNNNISNSSDNQSISIELQKSIISSCYDHLHTCQNIFTNTEHFSAKFKSDLLPVIKLLLLTLQNLEDILETGISLNDIPTGEFLEWMTNYSKISTTLNNMILKNSSLNNIKKDKSQTNLNNQRVPPPHPPPYHLHQQPQQAFFGDSTNSPGKMGYKPPSSPFGSPSMNSFLQSHSSLNSFQLYNSTASSNTATNGPNVNNNNNNNSNGKILPCKRDRCLQIIQLSQDAIMLSILSCLSLCYKDLKTTKYKSSPFDLTQQQSSDHSDTVLNYFKDSVGVFFSAIRTNIFCTFILLNPIYQL
ncbi:hypothetical protein DLAC_00190 [Tieghemostelium lacteum]|uniref:Uncharacterized protein n=1 Tax=Tieghemostelium lacteum TaxID=361077 RepID=A0A152A927_TIELA|nr:hypothetical protein DLAC_00190 [Tieghemostelium lacteum]|eukprot:KYR02726.1 hypothetical protein DLAC_00190 [Tieghemostelium lacteum]